MISIYPKISIFSISAIIIYAVFYQPFSSAEAAPLMSSPTNFAGILVLLHLGISLIFAGVITEKIT
jgi:hypothetical protein